MKQFLLETWNCNDCEFVFYTKGYPSDIITCPSCESEELENGATVKGEEWRGEELV